MSWLSEVENEATLALEGDEAFTEGYMDDLRMARVIRELAAYIKADLAYRVALINSDRNCIEELQEKAMSALHNMSPDAKEVINDSTAPRST